MSDSNGNGSVTMPKFPIPERSKRHGAPLEVIQQQLMDIGSRIRAVRKYNGLECAELAELAGFGGQTASRTSTISGIEGGRATTLWSLLEIAAALDVDPSAFFDDARLRSAVGEPEQEEEEEQQAPPPPALATAAVAEKKPRKRDIHPALRAKRAAAAAAAAVAPPPPPLQPRMAKLASWQCGGCQAWLAPHAAFCPRCSA